MARWLRVSAACFVVLACGCHRSETRREPPAPRASVARVLGVDAGEVEAPVDPPAAAGDLRAEIDAFATLDACVEQHAHLDPLLGDALEAIGYDTFVRDACRVLLAARTADGRACEAIDASALRRQCRTTVAALAGDADACPWTVTTRQALGRDPACLAMASRDARLCAALETTAERATCEATVRHDAAPCAKLPVAGDQARCRRDADRWRRALPAAEGAAALPAAEGTLRVDVGDAGAPVETSLASELARGLVLVEERGGDRFVVGTLTEGGDDFLAPSPHTQATLGVEIVASSDGRRIDVERAELRVPARSPLSTPLARSTLTATVDRLERSRGGAVSLKIDGDLSDSTGTAHVHAQVATFVRDVVKTSAIYGIGLHGFGDAGVLR